MESVESFNSAPYRQSAGLLKCRELSRDTYSSSLQQESQVHATVCVPLCGATNRAEPSRAEQAVSGQRWSRGPQQQQTQPVLFSADAQVELQERFPWRHEEKMF
ncbi:hypothetical protein LDENG_00257030 [Lucifuga dentata]|nr:hypothetical protein LDENG_00257030 [Lucifuga dentata]